MADIELARRASDLVRLLSRTTRFAGSSEEAEARALCRRELEQSGFVCTESEFEYSQAPGKWGAPLASAVQAATILLVARIALHRGPLVALIAGALLCLVLLFVVADVKRRWILALPFQRARATNLEASRGNPTIWLMAHLDSKSQTVPMLIRIASTIALSVVIIAATIVLLVSLRDTVDLRLLWLPLQIAAVIAALPSALCWVRDESPGAVDNASGVAAVLLAAQSTASRRDLGVVITSGEELGLAGARAWGARALSGIVVINCDTVDDVGNWRLMYAGARLRRIASAASAASASLRLKVLVSRFIPGILADSMALSDRGIEAATLSRGTLRTLARIHTRRDNSNAFAGKGVEQASALLAALTTELS
jgi:hypothetical protein